MADDRSYQDDEVRAIIDRALSSQPEGSVSHEDLLAIGAGVGLSRAALERAALDVREARLDKAASARVLARRRRGMLAHAFVFCAVNGLLFAINFLTSPGQWWVLFPVFGWGLGLLLHVGFGLFKAVSPARLKRERRRLQLEAGERPAASALSTGNIGLRVASVPEAELAPNAAEQPADGTTADSHERLRTPRT